VEQFTNSGETPLDGAINNAVTSLDVTSASTFPAAAPFRVRIDDEIIRVTGGAGTSTWTVERGTEGTTAASHLDLAPITHVVTVNSLNQQRADLFAGRAYIAPVLSSFAWINQSTADATDNTGSIHLNDPGHNGVNLRVLKKAAPSTPFTITAAFTAMLDTAVGSGLPRFGLLFRGAGGELATLQLGMNTAGVFCYRMPYNFSNPTTLGINNAALTPIVMAPVLWCRIHDDGTTNRTMSLSPDGITWYQLSSVARTTDFTPTEVGFFIDNNNGGGTSAFNSSVNLLHWEAS